MQRRLRAVGLVLFVANAALAACDDSTGADGSGFELPKSTDVSLDGATTGAQAIDGSDTAQADDAAAPANDASDASNVPDAHDGGGVFIHDASVLDASLCDAAIAIPQQGLSLMKICVIAN